MGEDTAVLVGCGSTKLDSRQPAWKLYDSTYAECKMTAAMALGVPFIASAKHGLVEPTERIDPYDETLHDFTDEECREWGIDVVGDIPDHFDEIVILAGQVYVQAIEHGIGTYGYMDAAYADMRVLTPFDETQGVGEQMGLCKELAAAVLEGGDPLDQYR